ncbi:hypothetical protein AB0I22_17545 [Streptomyces sp. NPDC050610]|uniref:hypothetical protein n=1 Tax=Streptomyces sp. NPDC050610 TaxID=3157097 RepID=UPI0034482FB0
MTTDEDGRREATDDEWLRAASGYGRRRVTAATDEGEGEDEGEDDRPRKMVSNNAR